MSIYQQFIVMITSSGGGSSSCSGGGSGCGCCGGSSGGWLTFGFANVIIIPVAILVIQFRVFIFHAGISIIDLDVMVCVGPGEQIAPIRVPFQLIHTPSIITIFLVWIVQSSPKATSQYIILNKKHFSKLLSKYYGYSMFTIYWSYRLILLKCSKLNQIRSLRGTCISCLIPCDLVLHRFVVLVHIS